MKNARKASRSRFSRLGDRADFLATPSLEAGLTMQTKCIYRMNLPKKERSP
ncbi:MAG: hypothetical protein F6J93_09530 [Oscillatoria sp. SIO1A7]|nr:hypothetical protein [Oscillatoria sp. SIO1A7]